MNKYFEAVKKGGDYWASYMKEDLRSAHVMNRISGNHPVKDEQIMLVAEKYPGTRRDFQTYTPGI